MRSTARSAAEMRVTLRTDRLIVVAIGFLLIAAAAVYLALQHAPQLNLNVETDRVLLAVLSIVMALLGIALLFVLLRNLIKLLVERRRQVLGSRFRTKLVFIFLVLVLIPSMALLAAAASLIRHIDESLFNRPLEQITEDSKKIVDDYLWITRLDCMRFGSQIAGEIASRRLLAAEKVGEIETRKVSWGKESGLDFITVYARGEDGRMTRLVEWERPSDKPRPPVPDAEMPGVAAADADTARPGATPSHTTRSGSPSPAGKAPAERPPAGRARRDSSRRTSAQEPAHPRVP